MDYYAADLVDRGQKGAGRQKSHATCYSGIFFTNFFFFKKDTDL